LNHINLVAANITSMLRKLPADTEDLQAKVTAISHSVGRAAKIIDHMRAFGRESSQALEAVSIPAALDGALTLLENQLKNKNIKTEVNLPSDLPPIRAVESQIEQVFLNIMGNAIDAICDTAPIQRLIAVAGRCDGEVLNITVRDTGGGMSDVQLEKLFDPFFTTKEVGKGTGLGGSISYGIVTGFGGSLKASNWDEGAQITLSFPISGSEE
jgi:C4-dicarboxylate-specific signal transduction histidine kinase